MRQVVYVLTRDGIDAGKGYLNALLLSASSLRRHVPDVHITCCCDSAMADHVRSLQEPNTRLVDRWMECADATGGPIHRSRFIKTSLRHRLDGPFVYLDCDSVVTGSLDPMWGCSHDLGFTVDAFFPTDLVSFRAGSTRTIGGSAGKPPAATTTAESFSRPTMPAPGGSSNAGMRIGGSRSKLDWCSTNLP